MAHLSDIELAQLLHVAGQCAVRSFPVTTEVHDDQPAWAQSFVGHADQVAVALRELIAWRQALHFLAPGATPPRPLPGGLLVDGDGTTTRFVRLFGGK